MLEKDYFLAVMYGGKVDPRFNILNMCQTFGWTYQEYLQRPLWFDALFEIKSKAEAKAQQVKSKSA
jgi:hypothetical protein